MLLRFMLAAINVVILDYANIVILIDKVAIIELMLLMLRIQT